MSAESLHERLARLRRETPAELAPRESYDVARLLARRDARLRSPADPEIELSPRVRTLGAPLRLEGEGRVLARRNVMPVAERHGSLALSQAWGADLAELARAAREPRLAGLALEDALFLDTETTGLSGGAGTFVWLVGLGSLTRERFEVWQGFLSEPADEQALLEETAARIAGASFVVSFFGKSFDRHRLEDKMRLFGIAPPFAEKPHLDLYWPLRRRHQGRFANCRLRTLEEQLCGVVRADDLPGSFAPAAWFDFLHGRAHLLEGVFQHNLDDVKSLVTLLAHLGTGVGTGEPPEPERASDPT